MNYALSKFFIIFSLDCDFEAGEEYFILPRTGSSFENFLTYGQINEFETYDLMEMIMNEPLSRSERETLINLEVMSQNWEYPFFYLDNKRINNKLRDYFVVRVLKKNNGTMEIFNKKTYNIEDVDIFLQAYAGKSFYFLFLVQNINFFLDYGLNLDNKIGRMNSTLEKDREDFEEIMLKKRNRAEKLRRNVQLLKVFQRIIIDEQLSMVNQNILGLMNLKDEKMFNEYIEYKNEIKK